MAFAKIRQFRTGWSYSRLGQYEGCPAQAAYKHLDKLPEPSSPHLERGSAAHLLAETHIKGFAGALPDYLKNSTFITEKTLKAAATKMPKELTPLAGEIKALKAMYKGRSTGLPIAVEEMWGFTRDWEPCRWDDWKNCYVRIKMDVNYFVTEKHVQTDDFKTGKLRPEMSSQYADQLDLYNVGALSKFAEAEKATARLLYLDLGTIYPTTDAPQVLYRDDLKKAQKRWDKRAKKLMDDTKFKPKPGNACRYCAYSASRSGPCKF